MATEDRFIPGQVYSGGMNADDTIETGLQFNPRHITVDGSVADQPIYND
jgi:hypothetical protein